MTTTLDPPISRESLPAAPDDTRSSDLDDLRAVESRLEQRAIRRDGWTLMMFGVAICALMLSVIAVGFGTRAISESKAQVRAVPVAVAPPPPAPAVLTSVSLSDMKVTPSATVVAAGKYTITINNAGMMAHELLVFHTDTAASDMAVGADGKVAEDAPGFKISDGDNLEPGASQTRVVDLTEPGIYMFVCNLPGHLMAGMHAVVTVK
jgi:uncharacterized cupredoxin-like copper-binding protein